MKPILIIVIALGLVLPVETALAADNGISKLTYDEKKMICVSCHSKDGNQPIQPDYPILAGQHYDYLVHSLTGYRTGQRQHPVMTHQAIILQLSEIDIQRMASHYSNEKGLTAASGDD